MPRIRHRGGQPPLARPCRVTWVTRVSDPFQEDADRLLRMLREDRAALAAQIVGGQLSIENVPGGYREVTGKVAGLDLAIDRLREVFRGILPEATKAKPKSTSSEY